MKKTRITEQDINNIARNVAVRIVEETIKEDGEGGEGGIAIDNGGIGVGATGANVSADGAYEAPLGFQRRNSGYSKKANKPLNSK